MTQDPYQDNSNPPAGQSGNNNGGNGNPPPPPAGQSGNNNGGNGNPPPAGTPTPPTTGTPTPPPNPFGNMGDSGATSITPPAGSAAASGYKFGDITSNLSIDNIKVPNHPNINFDEKIFLRLLSGSISLTKNEKKKIIDAIPKLSQFQIDELIKILEEEKSKFRELDDKHLDQLKKLEEKHASEWEALEMEYKAETKAGEDDDKAADIRKQLGL